MYLLAHVAKAARKHQLHLRVDVLYAILNDELAGLAQGVDALQLGKKLHELGLFQQSDRLEHGDVSHASEHVILSQIHVHLAVAAHGKAFNLLVYGEVFFPEFIHFLF